MSLIATPIFSLYSQVSSNGIEDQDNIVDLFDTDFQVLIGNNIKKINSNGLLEEKSVKTATLNEKDYENWWLKAIGADKLTYDGSGVKVAILDTGIAPSTDYNVSKNAWFINGDKETNDVAPSDKYGHGTHVAGIVGGNGDGSNGKYRGVAPGVTLYNARISNETGSIQPIDVVNAIQWCIDENVDIISMSFGFTFPSVYDEITNKLSNATDSGIICVASAGNSGPDYFTGDRPAAGIDVISVGATDINNNLASFSSVGPTTLDFAFPDVVAPGVDIISAEAQESLLSKRMRYVGDYFDYPDSADYIPLSGTSMSCPMVAGALAILLQAYPNLTPETARIALMEGATRLTDSDDAYYLKSGEGLINVPASLTYLENLESISGDINNTAKILPGLLPIKPYDLLHFPGDHQKYNLTVISGMSNNYDIEIPTIPGVTLTLEHSNLNFNRAGVNFTTLDIMIDYNATSDVSGDYWINITNNGFLNDSIKFSLDIRMPEHKILMESYHGLNDWLPEISFYQMGFYEAMNAITELNISIDYLMEYWTPDYNKSKDNSILTEERLSQYDLVVLQNPILPYSPLEMNNLVEYFNNGGNILFLGTLYQHLCIENINDIFSRLGSGMEINEENIRNENWLGIGASVSTQNAIVSASHPIFDGVSTFNWYYGSSLTCSGSAESLATIGGKTVAGTYNGSSLDKGKLVAFGDLHWMYDQYTLSSYVQDHAKLLTNLMEYYFPESDIPYSININILSEAVSNPSFNISIFIKNQVTESPISSTILKNNLSVFIKNSSGPIAIVMSSSADGVAFNNTIMLSDFFPKSNSLLSINVSFTIGSKTYNKTLKFLYFNQAEMPQIESFEPSISGAPSTPNTIIKLDKDDEIDFNSTLSQLNCDVEGYMSIYTYSYYNMKQTINTTLSIYNTTNKYSNRTQISYDDPSGYGIVYLIAKGSTNYINSKSPRIIFQILNKNPEIINETSSYNGRTFESTRTPTGEIYYTSGRQGDPVSFNIYTDDFEDNSEDIRVSVNFFICFISDKYIYEISPSSYPVLELDYKSGFHSGIFYIPNTMEYRSIEGIKEISTVANVINGYIGLFMVTIYDKEGGTDDFFVLMSIEPGVNFDLLIIIIVISILSIVGGIMIFLYIRSRRISRETSRTQGYQGYYGPSPGGEYETGGDYYLEEIPSQQSEIIPEGGTSCPNCGRIIGVPKKFCPYCGMSIPYE